MNTKRWALVLAVAVLASCAGVPRYKKIETAMRMGNFADAAVQVESAQGDYSGRSRLVYYMDRLLTSQLAGDFDTSNRYVELANQRIDDLYTKSVSGEAMSWAFNDSKDDYRGEHFERVMVHIMGMINYGSLGLFDEALVESRRADARLQEYTQKYGDKLRYKEDALARWLSAVFYESTGDESDAYLDYKKTLEAFEQYSAAYGTAVPHQAVRDALRLADRLGEKNEGGEFRKKYPGIMAEETPRYLKRKGEVIVLLYEGMAPRKETRHWAVPLRHDDGREQIFNVAYPEFVSGDRLLDEAWVENDKGQKIPLELFEDVEAIALKDLEDRMFKIKAKAIARAMIKFKAGMVVQKEAKNKVLSSILTNVFSMVTEQADTRSWRTLPARIYLARVPLEPGDYDLKVVMATGGSKNREKSFTGIEIEQGKQTFLRTSLY